MEKILLIVGASGSGKTTIADKLSAKYNLKVLPSYTTRPKRNHNETGHIFISKKEFDELSDKVTYLKRYGAEYCATSQQIDEYDIYIINPEAALKLKEKYKGNKRIEILYIESSVETRYRNMLNRGDSCRSAIQRIIKDITPYSNCRSYADYIVENELDTDLDILTKIIYMDIFG